MRINFIIIAAGMIIGVSLILSITSVWDDAPIVDEIPHIGAGYSYIAKGDHRLNPEHPPLAKDLAGIGMKIAGTKDKLAFNSRFWQEDVNGQWEFGRRLIFNSDNDANRIVKYAKLPQLIFFILSAVIIFIWAKSLYNSLAAIIALFLFSFSPTVIAHSRFVTTDMPALFGILVGTFFFLRFLEKPTAKNLWIAGFIFGIAQLTKYSVFLLVPFFLGLAVIYGFLKSDRSKVLNSLHLIFYTILVISIGFLFIVWPVYYFHTWNYPPELQQAHTKELLQSYGNRKFADPVIYLSDKPIIRGLAEYGLGLLMVTQRQAGGNTTYFLGEVRNWAWPHYFPVVYFLKEPLAFWLLLIFPLLYWLAKKKFKILNLKFKNLADWSRNNFTELTMLLWITLYWFTSIRSNLNIGVRHLLPVYGFTFILLSGQISKIIGKWKVSFHKLRTLSLSNGESGNYGKRTKIGLILVFLLFGWYLFENLKTWPHYLAYFNQYTLIRPLWAPVEQAKRIPGGHWYVTDSNLDWGQDLKRLAQWVDRNNIQKINLDYFGWADQSYYLKDKFTWIQAGRFKNIYDFLAENPEGGYFAVSATYYMGSREKPETSYGWLDDYKPIAIIGDSIFIWQLRP